jgi:hypothetical protein
MGKCDLPAQLSAAVIRLGDLLTAKAVGVKDQTARPGWGLRRYTSHPGQSGIELHIYGGEFAVPTIPRLRRPRGGGYDNRRYTDGNRILS